MVSCDMANIRDPKVETELRVQLARVIFTSAIFGGLITAGLLEQRYWLAATGVLGLVVNVLFNLGWWPKARNTAA
jgi:hypothetical protein